MVRVKRCVLCTTVVPGVSIYKFPRDEAIAAQWATFCGISHETVKPTTFLCAVHFTDDCFKRTFNSARGVQLKFGVIPSLNRDGPPAGMHFRQRRANVSASGGSAPTDNVVERKHADTTDPTRGRLVRRFCCICGSIHINHLVLSFYRFPRDAERREKWLDSLSLSESEISDWFRVCSRHFVDGDPTGVPTRSLAPELHTEVGEIDSNTSTVLKVTSEVKLTDMPHSTPGKNEQVLDGNNTFEDNISSDCDADVTGAEGTGDEDQGGNCAVSGSTPESSKRKFRDLQDFSTPDLETPPQKRRCLELGRALFLKSRELINSLTAKNRRLEKKLSKVEDTLNSLQRRGLISECAFKTLKLDMAEKAKQCWLVAIPGTPSVEKAFKELKDTVEKVKGTSATKFHIPSLRSCDFDVLIKATEEMPKLEAECEGLVGKFGSNLSTVLDKQTIEPSDISVDNSTIHEYLRTYKWDHNRYPVDQNIHTILSLLLKQCKHADAQRETKIRKFNAVNEELTKCLKRRQGPLTTRNYLGDLVTNEDFVVDSKFMKTLLVAVPKHLKDLWYASYERLHEEVVPRSSRIICEEDDFVLFSVVIFISSEKEFREQAKKHGFMAREYDLKENEMYEYNAETSFLYTEKNRLQVPLITFLKAQFSEMYIAYVHIKAVKIHIESLLRFGPAEPYQAAVLFVDEKEANKLRESLQKLYGKLEEQHGLKQKKKEEEVVDPTTGEYYPYVYTKIKSYVSEFMKK